MTDAEFSQRLRQEVAQWRGEQIVTEDQAEAILARYASGEADQRRSPARLLALLGATLVGIGVIVFFAANWQVIPAGFKWVLVFSAVFAAYYAGYRLRYEGTTFPGTGTALLFLGALFFGAGIFLIAQGFHVNANAPVLLLLWAVGVLPMAYLLGSRAMVVLVILDLAIAFGWELGLWFPESPFAWLAAYLLFGTLLYSLAVLQWGFTSLQAYRLPYGVLGLIAILGALFPLTFGIVHDESPGTAWSPTTGSLWRVGLLIGAAVLTSLAGLRTSVKAVSEVIILLVLILIGGMLFFYDGGWGTPAAILFNLLFLGLVIGAIAVGYRNRETAWINTGLLFFWFQVFARYFDWFWNLMPRSLFFIGAGVLLLGGGMLLERNRRRILNSAWKEGEGA